MRSIARFPIARLAVATMLCIVAAGCGNRDLTSGPDVIPRSVVVTGPVVSNCNNDFQLTASVYNAESVLIPGVIVVWSSSDTTVATVDQSGFVTNLDFGAAVITASVLGLSDSYTTSCID
jgi:hypothetical protein